MYALQRKQNLPFPGDRPLLFGKYPVRMGTEGVSTLITTTKESIISLCEPYRGLAA